MILTPYPAYKPTGVEWIGDIPEHWAMYKVKNVFALIIDPAPTNNDYELLSIYTDIGVKPRKDLEEKGNKASTTDGYWRVKKGDFIVNKLLAWMGAVGISDYDGVTSPAYDILRPKTKISGYFYHYLFRTPMFISEMKKNSRGIMDMRLRLYFDKLGDTRIPLPPIEEQTTIASFLDQKTAQIEQAISIKQQQIALLKERKQIIIQQAVTKGLNPNATMKDSGVEWIGDIPEHWEVKRLASLGRFSKGGGFSKSDLVEFGTKAILYGDIYTRYNFYIKNSERYVSDKVANTSISVSYGDLLFTGSGESVEDIGKVVVLLTEEKTVAGGDVIIFSSNSNNSQFLSYFLNTNGVKEFKGKTSKGEIIVHTYASKLREIKVLLPSFTEQTAIVAHIESQSTQIDQAIAIQQQQIDKLKEYKITLINSVVTGKVRVSDDLCDGVAKIDKDRLGGRHA